MKTFLLINCFFVSIGLPFVYAADISQIRNVDIKFMKNESFQRISEFFTNKENISGKIIFRSQKDEREGLYFILFLSKHFSRFPKGTYIEIGYIKSGSSKVYTKKFIIESAQNLTGSEAYVGLTGSDWNESNALSAWKVSICDSEGKEIIPSKQSFLWGNCSKQEN